MWVRWHHLLTCYGLEGPSAAEASFCLEARLNNGSYICASVPRQAPDPYHRQLASGDQPSDRSRRDAKPLAYLFAGQEDAGRAVNFLCVPLHATHLTSA